MLVVLTARQMQEIKVYASIEPISWDTGVSAPPKNKAIVDAKLDAKLDAFLGPGT